MRVQKYSFTVAQNYLGTTDEQTNATNKTTITYLVDSHNPTGYAQIFEEYDGTTRTYYCIGDDVLTQKKGAADTQYLLYDGLGSTRQLVNDDESVADTYSYDAYGNMLGGNPTAAAPAAADLLYAGEHFDIHSQHYYNRARWYDTLTGRFNRTDPFAGNLQDPQSLHKYLYCHANPLNNIDPTGRFSMTEMVNVSAIIGSISGIMGYTLSAVKGGTFVENIRAGAKWFTVGFLASAIAYGSVWAIHSLWAYLAGGGASLLKPTSWQEAESMLGKALQLPKNTTTHYYNGMTRGGIPDFIDFSNKYIHECKWVQSLYMSDQLRNYAVLAKVWGCRIYIYVREDTFVSSNVIKLVEDTGGGIVNIFK